MRIVVVGGGVVGAAAAYYLARGGARVTVLERGRFGGECSHANCGLIALSHVLPLNEPGAASKALRALLSRNSPFNIRPRLDPALWIWLARFAARCNERDMLASARARRELLTSSGELYRELIAREGIECEWEDRGCTFVYDSEAGVDAYRAVDRLLRDQFDLGAEFISGDDLVSNEPALRPGAAGAFHYAGDAHLRPDRLMTGWRRALDALGVSVREGAAVTDIDHTAGRATFVRVEGEAPVPADHVVVAAGALTPRFRRVLGGQIPIQPGKGYSLTMPRPTLCPKAPMIFQEDKVVVTPMQTGYRLGSTMEFAGYDARIREPRLELLRRSARRHLREPLTEPVEERWYGWRPMTVDGRPIIDRAPALANVHVAAGHNMLGLSMAPATGRLVSELILGRDPHIDPTPFRFDRF